MIKLIFLYIKGEPAVKVNVTTRLSSLEGNQKVHFVMFFCY